MNVLLTSSGLESKAVENAFLGMLTKDVSEVRALFIPTAANDVDAIMVLPKCLEDLLNCGIKNIHVYDLHYILEMDLYDIYDVIYICGGSTKYLINRINEIGFGEKIKKFIDKGGIVIGVSAGAIALADNYIDGIRVIPYHIEVHVDRGHNYLAGTYLDSAIKDGVISLSNGQALIHYVGEYKIFG